MNAIVEPQARTVTKLEQAHDAAKADPYLLALLETNRGLDFALQALDNVAAVNPHDADFIEAERALVSAQKVKTQTMITSYLSSQLVYKAFDQQQLQTLYAAVDKLETLAAAKQKAQDVVDAVTALLQKWNG